MKPFGSILFENTIQSMNNDLKKSKGNDFMKKYQLFKENFRLLQISNKLRKHKIDTKTTTKGRQH